MSVKSVTFNTTEMEMQNLNDYVIPNKVPHFQINKSNDLSITFSEYEGLPITNFWLSYIMKSMFK